MQRKKSSFNGLLIEQMDPVFSRKIIFINGEYFHLDSFIICQNYRFSDPENPHVFVQIQMHPQHVTFGVDA